MEAQCYASGLDMGSGDLNSVSQLHSKHFYPMSYLITPNQIFTQ